MIQPPRRSVTRFFIPLIDVLTLLFCIYLLMPLVKKPGEPYSPEPPGPISGQPPTTEKEPEKERPEGSKLLEEERLELERLRKEKIETLKQRLAIQVLEIDGRDGRLYVRGPQPFEVASQADALDLIDQHQRKADQRELYYLFLYPTKSSGYPEEGQIQKYKRWFAGVASNLEE